MNATLSNIVRGIGNTYFGDQFLTIFSKFEKKSKDLLTVLSHT